MANAVGFEGANKVYLAPKGMENCRDLQVFQHDDEVVSAWELTDEELAEVNRTGVVWLRVIGGQPPVLVSGTALVLVDGKPSRAEKYIPKRVNGGAL